MVDNELGEVEATTPIMVIADALPSKCSGLLKPACRSQFTDRVHPVLE